MWLTIAKRDILAAGLGPPGGNLTHGFSLSTRYNGPRWWKMDSDNGMDDFVRSQTRYHPEFIAIGEAAENPDDGWETIKSGDFFLGKDPAQIKILPVQDGDNKEKAVLLMIDEQNGEFRVEDIPIDAEDIVKELKNWEFQIRIDQGGQRVVGRKINADGDKKGIFEINGGHSVPGWRFWMKQTPSPTPGDKLHGDLSEFEWNNWRNEGGQPGM